MLRRLGFHVVPNRLSQTGIALLFALLLATSPVRAQQAYIPWSNDSERPTCDGARSAVVAAGRSESASPRSRLARWLNGLRSGSAMAAQDSQFVPPETVLEPPDRSATNRPEQNAEANTRTQNSDDGPSPEVLPQPLDGNGAAVAEYPVDSGIAFPADEPTKTYDSFAVRLFNAYFNKEEEEQEAEASRREGTLIPFNSPPFPFADHIGPYIGYRDTTVWPFMEALYKGPNSDWWKSHRIKIYGWVDPSVTFGTSRNSNIPLSYPIVPNSLQLSQAILIFERVTDSVQKEYYDWGFKLTNLYGIDYRYTTAKGWFSDQLLKHNNLYGYDPLQLYGDLYIPWVKDGMIIRLGRFISPIDVEAQLTTENYLYTHSLMYTYDPYTFTGLEFITKLNKNYYLTLGVHAGNDMAPWTSSAQPNAMALLKWVSDSGNNSLFGGLDSIGHGYYKDGHDDLQVLAGTWGHKFSDKLHTFTEAYYIWERNALSGGTVINGPPQPFFPFTGPGHLLPGLSYSIGAVNYTAYQTSEKSYMVFRSSVLDDPRGYRTGFAGAYFEHTFGFVYQITPWCISRPEVRFDYTSGVKGYDNGTRREQFTFNWDIIFRF